MRRLGQPGVIYVLTVTLAGRVYRFAETDVGDIDGEPSIAGLEVSGADDVARFLSSAYEPPEVTCAGLMFPVNLAALESSGTWLREGVAEVARWAPGLAWSRRQVVVRGRVSNPAYGLDGEPASIAIVADGVEELTTWPPESAKVDAATWPSAPAGSEGRRYPYVVGRPGLSQSFPNSRRGGSPAIVLSVTSTETKLLVCGARVLAGSVRVLRTDTPPDFRSEALAVSTETDGAGRTVSVVTWPYGSGSADPDTVDPEGGASFWVDWSTSDGGMNDDEGRALGPMGTLTEWMLARSSVAYDAGAWASARDALNAYRVDGYFDEPRPPFDTALQSWLWLAPVSVRSGSAGVYPIVWRVVDPDIDRALTVGEDCDRVGDLQSDDALTANAWRVRYAPDRFGEMTRTDELDADTSRLCAVSEDHFGRIDSAETMESRHVVDPATAHRAMAWRSVAYAFPHRVRQVIASTEAARELLPGDVVSFTDTATGVSGYPAHVVEIVRGVDSVTIRLVLLYQP